MPTPPKPYLVLASEKKSHRTKKELKQREQGEKELSSGSALKERSEVKNNPIAHEEFIRLNGLLENIEKNDAIYEAVINRYAMMQAECFDLEERREEFHLLLRDIRSTFQELTTDMGTEEKILIMLEVTKELGKITVSMNNIDKLIQSKRKMLLDIEKENIMTIAAALRSIPKKEESKGNALAEILKNG